ncbi:alpha/beta fold hydrolase [Pseudomonas sp. SDO528_S397]
MRTGSHPVIHLPKGIRSRHIQGVNGLDMHMLEAGIADPNRPCILLLHGFPELAYSWRSVLLKLADAGFYAIAPDQRGYGRTTGWSAAYEDDLKPFYLLNLVRDAIALLNALGRSSVAAVIGHDFGAPVAAYCALIRPDLFHSVMLMSAPFEGPPSLTRPAQNTIDEPGIAEQLARLSTPKKHYQHYFCTRDANHDMLNSKQGLPAFLRTYFHGKSGDWAANAPSSLSEWSPTELLKLPPYYLMELHEGMPEAIDACTPSTAEAQACQWLNEQDLAFFAQEFGRTGFQGGLNWYRCSFAEEQENELRLFAGRTIDVPSCFVYGEKDWGAFQSPGALQVMRGRACTDMRFVEAIAGGGHWVQQENAQAVVEAILRFLKGMG